MNVHESDFDELEGRLAGTLRPVSPPDEFVQRLRGHIHVPERGELTVRLREWVSVMVVFGGVLSGALVFVTVLRALSHILSRRNG
jgi:hypothetical protein